MSWDDETRLSIVNGRLNRLSFLSICLPFLALLDWLITQQLHSQKVPAFLFGKVFGVLLAVFCLLSRGRWRDFGSKVDAPLVFLVVNFIVFLLFLVHCAFYNFALLLMIGFLVLSAFLPPEDVENDFGLVPISSRVGRYIGLVFATISVFFIIKITSAAFFIRLGCS